MRESRGQMEERLREEGRLEEFAARRRELKDEGKTGSEAYQLACVEFGKDGDPAVASETRQRLLDTIPEDIDLDAIQKRKGNTLAAIEWVWNQILYVDMGLTPDWASAPCKGAISLLLSAAESGDDRTEFWRIWSKTIPTKSTIEKQERFHDDGRETLDTIEKLEAGWAAAGLYGMGEKRADEEKRSNGRDGERGRA